jgi:hypothetical protein
MTRGVGCIHMDAKVDGCVLHSRCSVAVVVGRVNSRGSTLGDWW